MNTASLPMTTPCSLAPISAPNIHQGRDSSTAWVWATCAMSIQVQRTVTSESVGSAESVRTWSRAGIHSSSCASLASRSLFLANRTPSSVTVTIVSHITTDPTPRPTVPT